MGPPNDETSDEPLPPADTHTRSPRWARLLGPLFEPTRHVEHIVAGAYLAAMLGLVLPLPFGFGGPATVLAVSAGLLFLSFVALFYCALVVTSASGARDGRARR